MPDEHSRYGASSMSRWANCPGSVKLLEDNPMPSSDYAREGTEAHDYCEHKILADLNGTERPVCLDEDMEMYTNQYTEYVSEINKGMIEKWGDTNISVEQRFTLSHIRDDAFGTNDCCIYSQYGDLHVIDFKYGKSKIYAKNNQQLMYYALGAVVQNHLDPEDIVLHIFQPRVKPQFNTWTISLVELLKFQAELKKAIKRVDEQPEKRVPGSYCFFCNRDACPEYQQQLKEKLEAEREAASTEPEDALELSLNTNTKK